MTKLKYESSMYKKLEVCEDMVTIFATDLGFSSYLSAHGPHLTKNCKKKKRLYRLAYKQFPKVHKRSKVSFTDKTFDLKVRYAYRIS
jgi:hypothetical protein